ncbi:MAG TPA: hypothetical protein HA257_07865 [Candidatus Methanoperedenaceae archaeon]|nr:hypothetical protein [Candidatus Methanoperedenaceae archaeon]
MSEIKQIQVTLTPAESKKLIALGVRELKCVKDALDNGIILITLGTTNAYVAEELLGKSIDKSKYAAGIISKKLAVVPMDRRLPAVALRKGKPVSADNIIDEMKASDVIIKGANALGPDGIPGVFMANPRGGTTGGFIGPQMSKGVNLVIPVGLEKSIPYSVLDISRRIGIQRCHKAVGIPVGMMPLFGTVMTEVQALALLGASDVFPMGAGGVEGGEGSVMLCVETDKPDEMMALVERIKATA